MLIKNKISKSNAILIRFNFDVARTTTESSTDRKNN